MRISELHNAAHGLKLAIERLETEQGWAQFEIDAVRAAIKATHDPQSLNLARDSKEARRSLFAELDAASERRFLARAAKKQAEMDLEAIGRFEEALSAYCRENPARVSEIHEADPEVELGILALGGVQ